MSIKEVYKIYGSMALLSYIITTFLINVLYCLLFLLCLVAWYGDLINVSVKDNNGGSLPNIILLTQGYYHWGTHLNTMKGFYF